LQSLTLEELKEFEILLNFTDRELSSWLVDNKKNLDIEKFSVSKKIKEFKLKF
jgi:succinate dehydrogenase flavin-adding protein (antitoxin of CptAB toxin-antitoxin module)